MGDLKGVSKGVFCPAYHKSKDRVVCSEKRCKFYVNHIITIGDHQQSTTNDEPDYDENLNAISIKKPVIRVPRVNYCIGDECKWHCCLYDSPSNLESLPWDNGE